GRAAVMQSWMEIFSGARPPTIEVEPVTTLVSGDVAVHVRTESIRPNGQPEEQASRVLATNVFRRRGGSWYLVVHQASLPLRVRPARGAGDHQIH
ncbi:MAG TPA: nuclear transport factor 2 family protein, partial [Chromatiaceae bacterium]|nr:nuclear transport factor 2 family protein [Chromatiaceae bacterium]